jgi:hypothetical protein
VVVMVMTFGFTLGRYEYFMRTPLTAGMLWSMMVFVGVSLVGIVLCLVGARWRIADRIWMPEQARVKMRQVDAAFGELTRQWRQSVAGCLIAVLVTLAYFVTFYCASQAVQGGVSLVEILTVMPVIDVMSALPISVSGLGVREKSFEVLLGVVAAVPIEVAVMISLAGFTASLVWSLIGGLVWLGQRLEASKTLAQEQGKVIGRDLWQVRQQHQHRARPRRPHPRPDRCRKAQRRIGHRHRHQSKPRQGRPARGPVCGQGHDHR